MKFFNNEVGSDLVAAPKSAVDNTTVNMRKEGKNLPEEFEYKELEAD